MRRLPLTAFVPALVAGALSTALAGCEGCDSDVAAEANARAGPVTVTVDADGPTRPISRWIYGVNDMGPLDLSGDAPFTAIRFGGNRATTYNWENNASNAGHDPPENQNDGYLSDSTEPGAAVLAILDTAQRLDAAALITVPMLGRVAADRRADGDVSRSDGYLETRFVQSVPRCDEDGPNLDDDRVCQHAFVRFVRDAAAERGVPLMFALDNEPGSWPVTHPLLRAERPVRYQELIDTSIEYATMIAEEAPDAKILGPVSFGWAAMTNLAGAPDADDRDFLATYLEAMQRASRRRGRRLLHALDVHWYPAVRVDGTRVVAPTDERALARERMQVPRSLYDDDYEEESFVVDDSLDAPVRLLPRLRELIEERYPGTELAITEWAYGGATHPSGAVAVADALGAMGRHGVLAAMYWPLFNQEHGYAVAAFRMFRPAEGIGFGDRSLEAITSDRARVSAWASRHAQRPDVVMVLVVRTDGPQTVQLALDGAGDATARRFELADQGAVPHERDPVTLDDGRAELILPARSVTTLAVAPTE